MSNVPSALLYTDDHEWIELEGGIASIGITDHAQDQLGDIVYLGEFPEEGTKVEAGDVIGVVESVKATSDIYAPLSGRIMGMNDDLIESPELVNKEPYGDSWMIKIKLSDKSELEDLLQASFYEQLIENEE